jgi:hypothetical protein
MGMLHAGIGCIVEDLSPSWESLEVLCIVASMGLLHAGVGCT